MAIAVVAIAIGLPQTTWAQTSVSEDAPSSDSPADTAKNTDLPFAIADEKRLSEEDLKEKKEGMFVTGLPDLSLDPLSGFGDIMRRNPLLDGGVLHGGVP